MGVYDVPANIDYILNVTGVEKLIYIGHSQGTTQYFAGLSTNPAYNSKIRIMVALAPPEFMNGTYSALRVLATAESPGLTDVSAYIFFNYPRLQIYCNLQDLLCAIGSDGTGAFGDTIQNALLHALLSFECSTAITSNAVCDSVLFLVSGYDYYQVQNVSSAVILLQQIILYLLSLPL